MCTQDTQLLNINEPEELLVIDCGELTANSCSVLSQGESVKYFLDNLDKLSDPVSFSALGCWSERAGCLQNAPIHTHTHTHELAQQHQVMLPFFFFKVFKNSKTSFMSVASSTYFSNDQFSAGTTVDRGLEIRPS